MADMEPSPTRQCPYCQQHFTPSRFCPAQAVCSAKDCQDQRKAEFHRKRKADDPVYAEACRDAQRHWREAHPGYQRQYRQDHPEQVERNRCQQRVRDQRARMVNLVKNNLALDLTASISKVYLVGPRAALLDKNNLAPCKLLICQPTPLSSSFLEKNNLAF